MNEKNAATTDDDDNREQSSGSCEYLYVMLFTVVFCDMRVQSSKPPQCFGPMQGPLVVTWYADRLWRGKAQGFAADRRVLTWRLHL